MKLQDYVRDIQDFPKLGIVFKDITPLLISPDATRLCLEILAKSVEDIKIDKVIGVESRGFFFGMLLAQKLNSGFVPVRKANKLPCETICAYYELEYGTDILEMHIDAIQKGDKVLIHDDVLATGGTASAVCKMVEQLGGEIVQVNFLLEITFLNGREKVGKHPVFSALKY
jgi:adenine phosphoribosyltransferase